MEFTLIFLFYISDAIANISIYTRRLRTRKWSWSELPLVDGTVGEVGRETGYLCTEHWLLRFSVQNLTSHLKRSEDTTNSSMPVSFCLNYSILHKYLSFLSFIFCIWVPVFPDIPKSCLSICFTNTQIKYRYFIM